MDESGEDRITNLPDDVVCHILSCLPTKDAMLTSILSKDWEHKWTSVYNIQLDDRRTSLRGKTKNKTFLSFVERVLYLTQNQRIKSFRLFCSTKLEPDHLKTRINSVLQHGVQNLEINAYRSGGNAFADGLYNCKSLTELKLTMKCVLYTSRMKDCFPNLKILYLCQGVILMNNEDSLTHKVSLSFPVLEELELRRCVWRWNVDSVDINAPALIRFLGEGEQTKGIDWLKDRVIKINGAKLQKFESCGGLLDNFVVTTPSVSKAVLTNFEAVPTLEIRAHAILKGFPNLESLKMSSQIVKALTKSDAAFPLHCFNMLKQLELCNTICDKVMLTKLLEAMPSLESLSLYVYNSQCYDYFEGPESLPAGIASRLKVVKLLGFGGLEGQFHLAFSMLKNVENLEELFMSVCYRPLMPKIEIRRHILTFPKNLTRASIVVTGPRNSKET